MFMIIVIADCHQKIQIYLGNFKFIFLFLGFLLCHQCCQHQLSLGMLTHDTVYINNYLKISTLNKF